MDSSRENVDVPWYDIDIADNEPLSHGETENEVDRFAAVHVTEFIDAQENKATARKTTAHLGVFAQYLLQNHGESRDIKELDPKMLNDYLSKFIVSVRKRDGGNYEPTTLRGFVASFEWHLKRNEYGHSIITSVLFAKTREALKSKQVQLKKEGMGNKPFKSEPITMDEVDQLYAKKLLGDSCPGSVLNTLWFNNTVHFGMRPVTEHRTLKWGDIVLKTDSAEREYLEYRTERQTKTRTGANPKDTRTVNPRMYAALPGEPHAERCPVKLYTFYAEKRPAAMRDEDSPFYVASNWKEDSPERLTCPGYILRPKPAKWFKNQVVGENKISAMMRSMKSAAGLSDKKKLTNTSARKFLMQTLSDSNVPPTEIMQISGHKNVQSILNYSAISEARQAEISSVLSGAGGKEPSSEVTSSSRKSQNVSTQSVVGSLFSGCTISGGTFHINLSVSEESVDAGSPSKRARLSVESVSVQNV